MAGRRVFLKAGVLTLGVATLAGFVSRAFAVPRLLVPAYRAVTRDCVITCPVCKTKTRELMVRESLKRVFHCPQCLTWLAPLPGDHCIYDSYGSVKCPQLQVKLKKDVTI